MTLTYNNPIVGMIRPSIKKDCISIGFNMRDQDAIEMWSYDRTSPIKAALNSFNKSIISMTITHDELPIAMFGIIPKDMSTGILWMLTTDELDKIGRPFVRNCKRCISDMLEIYPKLEGYVDLRNEESLKWLTFIGATWGDLIMMGIDNMPFKKFTFRKTSTSIIRKAEKNDIPKLVEIGIEFANASQKSHGLTVSNERIFEFTNIVIESSDCVVLVLENDGVIVGVIMGTVTKIFFSEELIGQELVWYVQPGASNGIKLLNQFEKECYAKGAKKIILGYKYDFVDMHKIYVHYGYRLLEAQYIKG